MFPYRYPIYFEYFERGPILLVKIGESLQLFKIIGLNGKNIFDLYLAKNLDQSTGNRYLPH